MDVEFEEVEKRVGEGYGAVLRFRLEVVEGERGGRFFAVWEGYVLEVSMRICDL